MDIFTLDTAGDDGLFKKEDGSLKSTILGLSEKTDTDSEDEKNEDEDYGG